MVSQTDLDCSGVLSLRLCLGSSMFACLRIEWVTGLCPCGAERSSQEISGRLMVSVQLSKAAPMTQNPIIFTSDTYEQEHKLRQCAEVPGDPRFTTGFARQNCRKYLRGRTNCFEASTHILNSRKSCVNAVEKTWRRQLHSIANCRVC